MSTLVATKVEAESGTVDVRAIHAAHADFVYRSLQRMGVRDAQLEDALQDVFVVVHRRLASFDGSAAMTTWLYGICLRVAAAHRRRASRRHERPMDEAPDAADTDTPEDAAERAEARSRLAAILDSMAAEKRAVLVMFEIEGMSCDAIAEICGVPVGTVYSRLSAARVDFGKAISRFGGKR